MEIKAKILCKSCSDDFARDKEMFMVQIEPNNEKMHLYKCPSCNKLVFIQEDFWSKEELELEKKYM
jgi:DNA-directed RNA polymerase subunit RPC12/RpoP